MLAIVRKGHTLTIQRLYLYNNAEERILLYIRATYVAFSYFLHTFASVKTLLIILGSISLALGIIGIFVPLLPTTPLLLLAAALYFRSSPRLYEWLLNHPRLGAYIRNFREYRAIPLRAKIVSVSLLWLTMGYCIIAIIEPLWLRIALAILAMAITFHILSFKTLRKS